MKTTYTIIEAHSGSTNAAEIAKAKRLFLAGVKKGAYRNDGDIEIQFEDVNNCVFATFRDANCGELLDTVEI